MTVETGRRWEKFVPNKENSNLLAWKLTSDRNHVRAHQVPIAWPLPQRPILLLLPS